MHTPAVRRPKRILQTVGRPWLLLLLLSFVAPSAPVAAQVGVELTAGDQLYEVRLADGSLLFARISSVDGDRVTLTTSGGTVVEVERSQIRDLRLAEGRVVEGEFWRKDANSTRLFFTATGRSLQRGEGYVGTYLIVLPFVAVGVTDRFTIGGGAPVLFGEFEPFYLTPKLQLVRSERANISVGALHFIFRGDGFDDGEDVGILYGVGTFGTDDKAVSLGLGFGYLGADFSSQPVAMLGAEARASRRVKWITENYFLPGETGVVFTGGIRYLGERFAADVAVAGAAGDGDIGCCFPLLSFSYGFGRGR